MVMELADTPRRKLLNILRKGRAKSLPSKFLAEYCGLPERQLRRLIRELISGGYPIASTTGKPPGFFLTETQEEAMVYAQGLRSRLIEDALRRRDFLRAVKTSLGPQQLQFLFKKGK